MRAARAKASHAELLREVRGGVAILTLNRPDQYNALSSSLVDALGAALEEIARNPALKVVLLAAHGRAFCAGHDLREMRAHADEAWQRELFERCGRMMQRLQTLPQPVVARVQGVATAAGCQLVASCDLAVAAASARFATSGINLGLFCSTPAVAVSRTLPRKKAFEMLFTGRFVDAATAAELGLVNRVAEDAQLDRAVEELVEELLRKPASALRIGKEMFYRQLALPLPDAYAYAARAMAANLGEADACEGIDAFLEKREPKWRGR